MAIDKFQGEYRWLSNFWSNFIELDGKIYPSVENAYQAAKTDILYLRIPFESCFPGKAKRMGKILPLRNDWDEVKVSVMRDFLIQKFSDPVMAEKLLSTEDEELIEGNDWGDTFWGVDIHKGGENMLGKLIMDIRKAIKEMGC